jgi:AcrR family transcriptional regulator
MDLEPGLTRSQQLLWGFMSKQPEPRLAVRDSEDTKARILEAAQQAFAEKGYAQGLVREIAQRAGIAPSLVMRYFGSKEGLFERAFERSLDLSHMLAAERSEFGENAVRLLSATHTDTVRSASMLALSIGDPQSRAIAVRLMESEVVAPLAERLGEPHAKARAQLVAMLTIGFVVLRILVPVDEGGAEEDAFVADWMRDALQQIAEGTPLQAAGESAPD